MAWTSAHRLTGLACGALLLVGTLVGGAGQAAASCLPSPGEQAQYDRAEIVVEGTFAEGPKDPDGRLVRPAAFDVARYAKGSGPSRIDVEAGVRREPGGGYSLTSIDVLPRAGEPWRLYGEFDEQGELATDLCRGSRKMTSAYAHACPSSVPEDGFADVPAYDVHEPAIDCAAWRQLVSGTGSGYAPGQSATRAQLATVVVAALEDTGAVLPAQPADAFSDDDGSPHEQAIDQLAAIGVLSGTGDRRFSPDAPVTRAQAVAVLVRAQERDSGEPLPVTRDHFLDDEDSAHEQAINQAADARYVGGTSSDRFSPQAALSRSQLASATVRWVDSRVAQG